MTFLEINNLNVSIDGNKILNDFNIKLKKGEIHAIMGPNGSGKSTLSNVLAGNENYIIDSGKIIFKDLDLLALNIEERALEGLFLAFQYPVEIPGVNITPFLNTSLNARLKKEGKKEIDNLELVKLLKTKATELGISLEMLKRSINSGFSGGEKKRYEILQMSILNPDLAILDETDSGLDIDALKIVANGVKKLKNSKNSFIIITHYQKLLDYIAPDFVHVMREGKIVKTGDISVATEIENSGYKYF
ncbi:MAG: putative ATP-dependent transporter SufC [Alphaproteobacteria bacterium MarineAlpha5_Bin5]|nr:MAG: putative ATP-dependent transporter SufC [Alphaproteobacteria bacterium MarineAlpha5_Bin5]PPR51139.1 MAG: putative ATP-dependent transporter SufC [Alphaproteobacteria bacterium MarineAlpha5_Bin4]|tara:strand:- start:39 stop:779 length:741 start_codon:yes stop_codon:yes gene_type:complete